MNTNKPLSEWTLGEIKSECKRCNGNCINAVCPMVKWISKDELACVIIRELRKPTPASWDLSEPPRWTDDEIKFAEIFKLACKNEIFFERLKGSQILLWGEVGIDSTANTVLPYKLLPSLKEGERVTLDEIIGGAE